jgi:hypothetical protein
LSIIFYDIKLITLAIRIPSNNELSNSVSSAGDSSGVRTNQQTVTHFNETAESVDVCNKYTEDQNDYIEKTKIRLIILGYIYIYIILIFN